jgi:hypothetical protein
MQTGFNLDDENTKDKRARLRENNGMTFNLDDENTKDKRARLRENNGMVILKLQNNTNDRAYEGEVEGEQWYDYVQSIYNLVYNFIDIIGLRENVAY